MKYNKLIRDKIPLLGNPQFFKSHIALEEEYQEKLYSKLEEEVQEFLESFEMEELADLLEVIHAICDLRDFDFDSLEALRLAKREEKGGFSDRIILDEYEP